jgi:hypothetical protein
MVKTEIKKRVDKYWILFFVGSLMIFLSVPAQAAFPEYFDIGNNFYTVYGYPNLSAPLLGDSEFSRGDTVTLSINIMNKGIVTGFKSEKSIDPDDKLEQKLQQAEMQYEAQKTTAIGIIATLVSFDPSVKIKSGPQEAGTLVSGQQTEDPVRFTIEIANNAPAGPHPLILNLLYGYQENVQIDGKNETDLGITDIEVGLWYEVRSQNITLPISVEEEADFEVINVSGTLRAGEKGLIYVNFKNTGGLPVKDATVRISTSDPFSTNDDQAFIGDIDPGESVEAIFNLDVDEIATSKLYGINSEIKYKDVDGHDKISDTIKIHVNVLPGLSTSEKFGKFFGIVIMFIILAVIGLGAWIYYKRS